MDSQERREGEVWRNDPFYSLLKAHNMQMDDMLKKIMDDMPGGFFVYRADGDEEIIYINEAMLRIFGCDCIEEFSELTGNTFRGIVHPDDLDAVEESIWKQIEESHYDLDYVEYRIIRKDGETRWIEDYGHYIHSEPDGGAFYVFVADATEKKRRQEEAENALLHEKRQKEKRLEERIEEYNRELEAVSQEQLRRLTVIEGLSIDYDSIFYADLDANWIQPYQVSGRIEYRLDGVNRGREFAGFDEEYIRTWVYPEDKEQVARATDSRRIKERLARNKSFHVNFRIMKDGRIEYRQLRVVNVGEENRISKIVMGYRSVDDEITYEMEQKGMLEDALRHVKTANKAKDVFLANMSHDMRTPMNAIMGSAVLAKKYLRDQEKAEGYLNNIVESGDHLLSLINDVLEISRLDSGNVMLEEGECKLEQIMEEVHRDLLSKAEAKKISFCVDVSKLRNQRVCSDAGKLKQIFRHICNNAVEYTERGGSVLFSAKELEENARGYGTYCFMIEDNGVGMSEEFQKHMFEPFERQKNSTQSRVPGTGLGLTIVKSIIDMMDGGIEVFSEESKGSRFVVTLRFPLWQWSDDRGASDRVEAQEAEDLQETGRRSDTGEWDGISQDTRKKILLVEDNPINLELEAELLEDEGFCIEAAEDGRTAVEKVRNSKPGEYALILMDIQMPVMDGHQAAREIRKLDDSRLANIPIIAVSANAFEEDRKKSLESGMNGHVPKPVDIVQLMEMIDKVCALSCEEIYK